MLNTLALDSLKKFIGKMKTFKQFDREYFTGEIFKATMATSLSTIGH